jgi:hypothetical protein
MSTDVFCAVTGTLPDDADLPIEHPLEDDDLTDLPLGWTRITLQTRVPNPAWQEIVAVEEAMIAQVVQGLPKAQRKQAVVGVRVQVAAQLAALKAATAPYVIETEVAHIAPGEDGAAALNQLRALLGAEESPADGGDADADGEAPGEEAATDEAPEGNAE